jgi:hypothetical protein
VTKINTVKGHETECLRLFNKLTNRSYNGIIMGMLLVASPCIVVSLGGKQWISFTTKVWQKVIIVQFMAVQTIADTRKNK